MSFKQAATRAVKRLSPRWRALSALAAAAALLPASATTDGASAKTPGKTYCFNRTCHRVLTLAETRAQVGRKRTVHASFYRHCKVDRFNPCGLTSSGAVYRPDRADNAASPIYPNGTKLLVWNPATKRAAVVRINNAGPYWGKRTLDLSSAAADKLGFRARGVANLTVQVLQAPSSAEASYRRHRVYAPVAGYIGRHASLASAAAATGGRTIASSTAGAKAAPATRRVASRADAARAARRTTSRLPTKVARQVARTTASRRRTQRVAAASRRSSSHRDDRLTAAELAAIKRQEQAASRRERAQQASSAPRIAVPARRAQAPVVRTVQAPAAPARPNKQWRRKYFGPTGAGA